MTNDQVHFSCLQSDTGPSALLLTRLRLPIFAHDNGMPAVIRKIYSVQQIDIYGSNFKISDC